MNFYYDARLGDRSTVFMDLIINNAKTKEIERLLPAAIHLKHVAILSIVLE